MFCKNCGIELEDTMALCPECGAPVESEPACEEAADTVEVVATAQADAADYGYVSQELAENVQAPAKKSNKILVSIIAVVLMVALVVAGVFVVPKFFGESYEDVAKNYGLAYAEADLIEASKYCLSSYVEAYDKVVDYSCSEYEMTREDFFEVLSEQYGEKITDIDQLFAIMKEEAVTYLQEEYGNYTISAKIAGSEEMSAESITELKEYITEDQGYDYPSMFEGVDADKISAGYIVEVELTINGTESTDTESQEVTVVKYNGKWKAIGE